MVAMSDFARDWLDTATVADLVNTRSNRVLDSLLEIHTETKHLVINGKPKPFTPQPERNGVAR